MNRRGFLLGASASLAMPAIVRAENIMPIFVPKPAALSILPDFDLIVCPPLIGVDLGSLETAVAAVVRKIGDGWIIEQLRHATRADSAAIRRWRYHDRSV